MKKLTAKQKIEAYTYAMLDIEQDRLPFICYSLTVWAMERLRKSNRNGQQKKGRYKRPFLSGHR